MTAGMDAGDSLGSYLSDLESEKFSRRMRAAVTLAWRLFSRKVGDGLIEVHKEASMQLQYAYVLQQLLPLLSFHPGESFTIELENGVRLGEQSYEVDLLLTGRVLEQSYRIAVEMKCYRVKASSGKPRGATDIFMKDVYEDLSITERYVTSKVADEGVVLVMNEHRNFVTPASKAADCWRYDISHGASFGPTVLTMPIGGKDVRIELKRQYKLEWRQHGKFWFLEAQGA